MSWFFRARRQPARGARVQGDRTAEATAAPRANQQRKLKTHMMQTNGRAHAMAPSKGAKTYVVGGGGRRLDVGEAWVAGLAEPHPLLVPLVVA